MKLLRIIPLFFAVALLTSCGDDEDKQFCASCSNDQGEIEICADSESELDTQTDDYLDSSTGSAICINN